jgi:hypothetical protein
MRCANALQTSRRSGAPQQQAHGVPTAAFQLSSSRSSCWRPIARQVIELALRPRSVSFPHGRVQTLLFQAMQGG